MNNRRSFSSRTVLGALFLSFILALGFGIWVYGRFIRYEPRALRYIEAPALLSAWINVEQAVVYDPFRKNFLPLLEAGRVEAEPRLLHLERLTTLELGVDTRELAFSVGSSGDLRLVLGGLFRRDGVAAGVVRLLRSEGAQVPEVDRGANRALIGSGALLTVTPDGCLVLSGQAEGVRSRSLRPAPPPFDVQTARLAAKVQVRPDLPLPEGGILREAELEVLSGVEFDFALRVLVDGPPPGAASSFVVAAPNVLASLGSALGRAESVGVEEGARLLYRGTLTRAEFEVLLGLLAEQIRAHGSSWFDRPVRTR